MKQEIIRKALVLLGANSINLTIGNGSKLSKAENLCEEFVNIAIEETFLAVKWPFALSRVAGVESNEDATCFKQIPNITDCIKIAVIAPSNIEWYIESGSIFFKGRNIDSLLYFARDKLDSLLNNDNAIIRVVPESFKLLASLSLVSQISFAMYSDSLFADGLKKQYLIKLDEVRRLYAVDYNLVNSGEV